MSWSDKAVSPDEAVACVGSGNHVFLHGIASSPLILEEAMCRRRDLEGVRLWHLHKEGPARFAEPDMAAAFRSQSLFTGANLRAAVNDGRADYVPVFLSEIPSMFRTNRVNLDVAVVSLSPPDRHGWCTLGPSVDIARAAVDTATYVVAEINPRVPRTHGDSMIHIDKVHRFCLTERALPASPPPAVGDLERAIASHIIPLIEDGSTLQLGIGAIPDAVVAGLGDKNDLGIHTEMFADGVVELMSKGVINNRRKAHHEGHTVTSFAFGSERVYEYIDDNPAVRFLPCDYTNDTRNIRKQRGMVAINSALEIDLTGQVCADSLGSRIYSGIGGQMDFIRGASLAPGGKPIIALPATAAGGKHSRIVHQLKPGAGVVTTRGHVHWVVTEFGAVNLHARSLRERAEMLISIAHPDKREELRREAAGHKVFGLS